MHEHKYILDGHTPVPEPDILKWAEWFERDIENRRVAMTKVGKTTVYTSFLGIDHNFGAGGPPVLFETMAQNDSGRWHDRQERYHTWEEAEAGHKRWVEALQSSLLDSKT